MDAGPDRTDLSEADLSLDQIVELERRAQARQVAEHAAAERAAIEQADGGPGGVVVLPWWQHPLNIVTLVVTAALVAGMIGWMIGDSRSGLRHNAVDTGFLHDMREHHEQAVLMSFVFRDRPDTDDSLAVIAGSIIQGQGIEIGRMIQLLRDFGEEEAGDGETTMQWMGMSGGPGQMPGMASEAELDELAQSSGRAADELFVRLMVAHHRGGIDMAEYAVTHARSDAVKSMAASIAGSQRDEIAELEGRL